MVLSFRDASHRTVITVEVPYVVREVVPYRYKFFYMYQLPTGSTVLSVIQFPGALYNLPLGLNSFPTHYPSTSIKLHHNQSVMKYLQ